MARRIITSGKKATATPPKLSSSKPKTTTPPVGGSAKKKDGGFSLDKLTKIKEEREARRKAMADAKTARADKAQAYKDAGIVGDVDFMEMIQDWKTRHPLLSSPHTVDPRAKMTVVVRKRPLNSKEVKRQEHDCLTVANPYAVIHESKSDVAQYKFLNNLPFKFDHVFGEESDTKDLYEACMQPLVEFMVEGKGGYATVFAYGQTGSGKTFTMGQAQAMAVSDLFGLIKKKPREGRPGVFVACFEIYGPKCQDLLNNRERLEIMETAEGTIDVVGLAKVPVGSPEELQGCFDEAMGLRTTSKTDANDASSRSHCIMQIFLHPPGDEDAALPLVGMLSVVDLAGSERGQDTKSHSRQLRTEGAEINKSLLALKECIRAMQVPGSHVSFRASKLTQILKASFTAKNAMTVMVAAVSPAADSADHTINTLRYADRVKEKGGNAGKVVLPIDHDAKKKNKKGAAAAAAKLDMDEGEDPAAAEEDEEEEEEEDEFQDEDEETEESAASPPDPGYERVVEQLNEAEEALLAAHISATERNAAMCVDEGNLLGSVLNKDVVDYDIDEYADKLEAILLQRLSLTNELQRRLADFRAKSRAEETQSRRLSFNAKSKKTKG